MEPLDSPPNELLLNFGETNLRTKPRGFKPETSPHGFHDGQMVRGMREATTRPKIKIHYSNSLNREGSSKLGPPIRLYQVSVGTQTSSHDWVDLVSENYSKSDSLSKSWVDLVSKSHQVDLVTKSRQVDLASKNEVDLISQNLPSGSPELAINELVMANLEFYRSDVLGTNECVHFSVSREGLSRLPEVYEDPIPQPCAGEGDCPPRTNELFVLEKGENSGEQEKDSTPGALPLVPECNTPPVTSLPPRESNNPITSNSPGRQFSSEVLLFELGIVNPSPLFLNPPLPSPTPPITYFPISRHLMCHWDCGKVSPRSQFLPAF